MAKVKSLDKITGNIGKLSFYTRKGSDEIYVRTKGGASKEKIKHDPAFAKLRKANKEFGGCSRMSKQIRMTFYGLEHVADYNLSATLNALTKTIQKTDTTNPVGQRDIALSNYRYLLTGFDFSRTTRFNSLLRVPLTCHIDREKQQARVHIPSFACSLGLNSGSDAGRFGQFRITAALGIATDMALNPANQTYVPVNDKLTHGFQSRSTTWYSTQTTVPEQDLLLTLIPTENITPEERLLIDSLTDADTLIVSVILEFGAPDSFGNTMPVKGVGGGMIIQLG